MNGYGSGYLLLDLFYPKAFPEYDSRCVGVYVVFLLYVKHLLTKNLQPQKYGQAFDVIVVEYHGKYPCLALSGSVDGGGQPFVDCEELQHQMEYVLIHSSMQEFLEFSFCDDAIIEMVDIMQQIDED